MKAVLALFCTGLLLPSCMMNPNNNSGTTDPNGPYTDPNNPYAVPGVSTNGAYSPAQQAPQVNSPYQPIPDVQVNAPASYTPPAASAQQSIPSTSSSGGGTHTVATGDTLWGISRKYGVSVDSIRQANSLTSDTIITGQSLSIPR